MTAVHRIKAGDMRLLVSAAKLRRYTNGRTCQLAAITGGPVIHTDCSSHSRARMRESAMTMGRVDSFVGPMGRGHLAELVLRTRLDHGLGEVRKTWHTGLRALLDEDRHVLNGGRL
jgi:hypothetical protein